MDMQELGQPGVYVIGTGDGTVMQYPWGTSPVFYIGKSENLRSRLSEHRGYIRSADTGTRHYDQPWWPRYQYSVAFGSDVAVYLPPGGDDADTLERAILNDFYRGYGSIPVANAAWPSRMPEPAGSEDDA